MNSVHCENCGASLITEHDQDGTGNYAGGDLGWVCDDCYIEWQVSKWYHAQENEE